MDIFMVRHFESERNIAIDQYKKNSDVKNLMTKTLDILNSQKGLNERERES